MPFWGFVPVKKCLEKISFYNRLVVTNWVDCLLYHNMLRTLELNCGMLDSHVNVFIWQGIILLFFIIFPLMVKFLLTTCKERCEDGACWYRRVQAAHGPLSEELLEEGPLEARMMACGTDRLFVVRAFVVCASSFGGQEAVGACAALGCCTPECCPWSGALPWGESLDHATPASLHPLPVPRWRVGLCWRLHARIQLRALEWGQEAGVLPKEPFFSSDTYVSGCLHTLLCRGLCLQAPRNPALSLAVSSGQPASPSLAFWDLCLSLGSSGGHGTPGIVISGWDSVLGKSFQQVCWLLSPVSRKGQVWAACQHLNREVTSAYPNPRGVGDNR